MPFLLFAPAVAPDFATALAARLGVDVAPFERRLFEDGEHKGRPLVAVRGACCVLLAALRGDESHSVNDALVQTLFAAGALRDAGAAQVVLAAPYLCYARKDARTQPQDPIGSRYVAQLVEAMGVDLVVACEVHNRAAFENAFRIPTLHVDATPLFVEALCALPLRSPVAVVSPDAGGMKRAERLRRALEARLGEPVGRAILEKRRSGGVVAGEYLAGDVAGHDVVVVDDLVSGGTTLARTAATCTAHGARCVHAAITHGLFNADATALLADLPPGVLFVTDTAGRRPLPAPLAARVHWLDSAPMLANALRPLLDGGDRAGFP